MESSYRLRIYLIDSLEPNLKYNGPITKYFSIIGYIRILYDFPPMMNIPRTPQLLQHFAHMEGILYNETISRHYEVLYDILINDKLKNLRTINKEIRHFHYTPEKIQQYTNLNDDMSRLISSYL